MTPTTDAREIGIIKSMTSKGFGFIRRSNNADGTKKPDVFVHAAECNNLFDTFKPGMRVEFGIDEDSRGRVEAKNVTVID